MLAAVGNMMNLYPKDIQELIENSTDNVRHQETLEHGQQRIVTKSDVLHELKEVKDLLQKLVITHAPTWKPCRTCLSVEHKIDTEEINAVEGCQNKNNRYRQGYQHTRIGLLNDGFSWKDANNFNRNPSEQSTSQ